MLALQITSLKTFMSQLLSGDVFDPFLLEEATIRTALTYTIDGHIQKEFYAPEERDSISIPYEFQPWSETKGLCFQLIKGKRTPLYFKFVLQLKPEKASRLLTGMQTQGDGVFAHAEDTAPGDVVLPGSVKALLLNIKYDGTQATLTTGTSYHTFLMTKEADQIWDKALLRYLSGKGISYEELT